MSDLDGNPNYWFSNAMAHIKHAINLICILFAPSGECYRLLLQLLQVTNLIMSIPWSHFVWNISMRFNTCITASFKNVFLLCKRHLSCIVRTYAAWISIIWSKSAAVSKSLWNSRPALCRI